MSSHHLNHDPNYLLHLQNMRISEGNKSPHRLENNLKDNQQQPQQMVNPKNYDRNTILTSSKFPNQQQQHHQQHSSQGGYYLNNSPTHSLSGSSQHSESPRTSLIGAGQLVYDARSGHLYENLDYYSQHSPTEQIGYFESSNKKAQPQVPIGGGGGGGLVGSTTNGLSTGRYAHTPQPEYEPPPIYENLQQVTGQRAQPQASPANATMYYERNGSNSPHQQQQQQPQLPPPYPSTNSLNQSRNSPIRGQHSHTSSNASIKSQYSNNGQTAIGGNYSKQMPIKQQQLPQQPSQQQLAQQQNYVQYATMKPISNNSSIGSAGVFYNVAPQQSAVPAYEYKAPERHHSSAVSSFLIFVLFN